MRSLKPQNLFHGMEPLLGHYGVQVNRDLLVDRVNNGKNDISHTIWRNSSSSTTQLPLDSKVDNRQWQMLQL